MIKTFIKKLKENQKILVSYSGGLDSTVLLHQLIPFINKYPFIKLRAIHINHQINNQSLLWSKHCKKTCQIYKIKLIIKKIQINNLNNLQDQARKMRYKVIKKCILKNEILVTGHHKNDQCESLFLSLKRGSGITGLSGMSFSNILYKIKVFKPFLKIDKIQLQKWAVLKKINWINDNSNQNNKYDRNFIRNQIINKIQQRWPYFINNCIKSMILYKNQNNALNFFLDKIINKNIILKGILKFSKIYKYCNQIKILIIRRWLLLSCNHRISYNLIKKIYKNVICIKKKYSKYQLQNKNHAICKYHDIIFKIYVYPTLKNKILFWHNYHQPLKLPQNIGYLKQDQYGLSIPQPYENDIINIRFQCKKNIQINENYKIKIKNIWMTNKIPPWDRNRIPMLFYNNQLIAIIGIKNIHYLNNLNNHPKTWKISWSNPISYHE